MLLPIVLIASILALTLMPLEVVASTDTVKLLDSYWGVGGDKG
jgi:hypothetical protein